MAYLQGRIQEFFFVGGSNQRVGDLSCAHWWNSVKANRFQPPWPHLAVIRSLQNRRYFFAIYRRAKASAKRLRRAIRELKQQRRWRLQKRYLKSEFARFKLYRAYSISFTSSNVGKCFWSWILKDCIKVQEKKRKFLSCVPVLDKTWIQALSRCSRATTAKKCTKSVIHVQSCCFAFLPFSLPSASSLLKLPNITISTIARTD